MCRSALYQIEHIDPEFHEAREHNADNMCCLCGTCHDAVTRRLLSKRDVRAAYDKIRAQGADEAAPPSFRTTADTLIIGGLAYVPAMRSLLRYHHRDLISLNPPADGQPGSISAVFTDADGKEVLWLDENEWIGATDNWDLEVQGRRIIVRPRDGEIALQLRLEPEGRMVIERLDMHFADAYVMASEQAYAIGRDVGDGRIFWASSRIDILRPHEQGAALEFADPRELQARLNLAPGGLRNQYGTLLSPAGGMVVPEAGISVASFCTSGTRLYAASFGAADPVAVRRAVFYEGGDFQRLFRT
jgi:hypothetical protein